MAKKAEKQDGITINIPQHMMDALGIDKDSELDMIAIDDEIIIRPSDRELARKKREQKFKESIDRLFDKYGPLLEKLAKT